jgi:hypothetical protein
MQIQGRGKSPTLKKREWGTHRMLDPVDVDRSPTEKASGPGHPPYSLFFIGRENPNP